MGDYFFTDFDIQQKEGFAIVFGGKIEAAVFQKIVAVKCFAENVEFFSWDRNLTVDAFRRNINAPKHAERNHFLIKIVSKRLWFGQLMVFIKGERRARLGRSGQFLAHFVAVCFVAQAWFGLFHETKNDSFWAAKVEKTNPSQVARLAGVC